LQGIVAACEKTGVAPARLESIVDEIEAELQQRSAREVPSSEIGELVLQHLQELNEVAYIRFASIHRQFKGIRDFVETLNHLQSTVEHPSVHADDQHDHINESEADHTVALLEERDAMANMETASMRHS
jgi:transcriptional repressor NrdR